MTHFVWRCEFVLVWEIEALNGDVVSVPGDLYVWQSSQIIEILAEALLVLKIPNVVSDGACTTVRVLLDGPIMQLSFLLQNLQGLGGIIDIPDSTFPRINFDLILNIIRTVIYGGILLELLFSHLELFEVGFILLIEFDDLPVSKLNWWTIR